MLSVLKMKQSPQLRVSPQDHVAATASVSAIGSTFFDELFAVEMQKAGTTMPGPGAEFYVVDEVSGCQFCGY